METQNESGDSPLKKRKKLALGRGLGSLIPDIETIDNRPSSFFMCDVHAIHPNRYQPRLKFSEEQLRALSESIKDQGIIQPLLVRKDGEGYELIAGERRLRAAKLAGIGQVPVVIKEATDAALVELSIVENIQRADLNPLEEAAAYQCLMNEFHLTQEMVAAKVGKSRSAVANFLRLLNLPDPIKSCILDETLSMGHARALLGAETPSLQLGAWREVMKKQLSVRQTEALIHRMKKDAQKAPDEAPAPEHTYYSGLSRDLSQHYGTKVSIKRRGRRGKVEIEFYSDDDLNRILTILRPI
jgi:ParB family chromosome partitioning protein